MEELKLIGWIIMMIGFLIVGYNSRNAWLIIPVIILIQLGNYLYYLNN